jgi:hypothetical protein
MGLAFKLRKKGAFGEEGSKYIPQRIKTRSFCWLYWQDKSQPGKKHAIGSAAS